MTDALSPVSLPLTVTHALEHLFCPRFTYFEYVLCVPERTRAAGAAAPGTEGATGPRGAQAD
jgi:hypothetical protein